MQTRLIIVEGLPGSGKSSLSAYAASVLAEQARVCFVDEGTGDHPADYEFHALAPAGLLSPEEKIVPLSQYSGAMLQRLLPYKIYDALPWEKEKPLMLQKWRQFAANAAPDAVYVFNCVLLQNPLCETMMRFGFPEEVSRRYILEIAGIIAPMRPVVIYLKTGDIAASIRQAAVQRPGWLEAVIDYHTRGAYGQSIGAEGFDGYIACLRERQARELRILAQLPFSHFVVEDPMRDWQAARGIIARCLREQR